MPYVSCAARNLCDTRFQLKGERVTRHGFPTDQKMRQKWVDAMKQAGACTEDWKPVKSSCLCAKHFTASDYANCKVLRGGTVPSVFIRKPKLATVQQSSEITTITSVSTVPEISPADRSTLVESDGHDAVVIKAEIVEDDETYEDEEQAVAQLYVEDNLKCSLAIKSEPIDTFDEEQIEMERQDSEQVCSVSFFKTEPYEASPAIKTEPCEFLPSSDEIRNVFESNECVNAPTDVVKAELIEVDSYCDASFSSCVDEEQIEMERQDSDQAFSVSLIKTETYETSPAIKTEPC